ncbi:hypothetical protein COO60DRAFT_1634422 [Scenedesmus sp. NREL 46B-D3]|nr:hypothetical protein COO60DRAFT_1634422 [Scenedesmus sp. NREL 46B-D3]
MAGGSSTAAMKSPGGAQVFRDIKPENITISSLTKLAAFIDCGCMVRADLSNFFLGGSISHVPPEMAKSCFGAQEALHRQGTSSAMDLYLVGLVWLEVLVGLPEGLDYKHYDLQDHWAQGDLICAVVRADFSAKLAEAAAADAESASLAALAHPTLRETAAEVAAVEARAMPAYVQRNQAVLDLLAPLSKPGFLRKAAFLAHQHSIQATDRSSSCSSPDPSCSPCSSPCSSSTTSSTSSSFHADSSRCSSCSSGAAVGRLPEMK